MLVEVLKIRRSGALSDENGVGGMHDDQDCNWTLLVSSVVALL